MKLKIGKETKETIKELSEVGKGVIKYRPKSRVTQSTQMKNI
jgi:hypothetical protein